ncbi:MAG TPA: L,D-transpeptidase family protein [Casimicrobiaceae bacterium]|nr:L,D-transpeptidase family protein [Casimicrobiaceae bacterium]
MRPSRRGRDIALACCLAAWALAAFAGAAVAGQPDQRSAEAIRALIQRGHLPQLKHADFSRYRSALDAFYKPQGYAPQWLADDGRVKAALAELAAAPEHGLDPEDYDLAWLREEFAAIAAGARAGERAPRADVALTVALFRMLSDLHAGRVSPEQAGFRFTSKHTPLDLSALVRDGLAAGDLHQPVVAAEPSFPLYQRMEAALAHYRGLAEQALPAIPPLPKGVHKIEPGRRYAGVNAIAERLRRTGDLPPDDPPPNDRYEGALVDAVRTFQGRHGLKDDGILGRETLAALAAPFSARVRQIELTLERLRWLPELPPGPLIAVNIPSFRLWAFANGRRQSAATLTMPVIVGGAVSAKKTPVFIGDMRYVEFDPYWNVPPNINRKEIVPRLRRDPGYWEREGFEAVPVHGGQPITALDAATLEALASGALRVRQRPGEKNALGAVKFVLPNTMDIYLHGTPAQRLFERSRRDFSHGCIRVEDPAALAQFVLADQPQWTPQRIDEAMGAGVNSTVRLTQPIPVVIFYTTAIVDATGRVLFAPDIYGYDAKLERALSTRYE